MIFLRDLGYRHAADVHERRISEQGGGGSFNKSQWATAAHTVVAADWIVQFHDCESGRQVLAFDPSTKIGLSIQPHFADEKSPPDLVVIGNYYPIGTLGSLTEEDREAMEAATQEGLGRAYHVRLRFRVTEDHEVVEFWVTEFFSAAELATGGYISVPRNSLFWFGVGFVSVFALGLIVYS